MFINAETPHSQFEWGVLLFMKITQKELKIISCYKSGRQSSIRPSVSTLLLVRLVMRGS